MLKSRFTGDVHYPKTNLFFGVTFSNIEQKNINQKV